MPVYTYRCENCGVQFDWTLKFTDPPLTICPDCGQPALRKVFTPVGIVFKGSGFYSTDHRSPSGQTSRANGGKQQETAAPESKTTPEAAPAAKSSEKTSSGASE